MIEALGRRRGPDAGRRMHTSKEVGRCEHLQLLAVVGTVGIGGLASQHLRKEAVYEDREG